MNHPPALSGTAAWTTPPTWGNGILASPEVASRTAPPPVVGTTRVKSPPM